MGARKTGAGTTEPRSPLHSVAGHTIADAALSYRVRPNASLDLIAQNLTDQQYYDPGADFVVGAARIPQAGRTVYLRLSNGLSLAGIQRTSR